MAEIRDSWREVATKAESIGLKLRLHLEQEDKATGDAAPGDTAPGDTAPGDRHRIGAGVGRRGTGRHPGRHRRAGRQAEGCHRGVRGGGQGSRRPLRRHRHGRPAEGRPGGHAGRRQRRGDRGGQRRGRRGTQDQRHPTGGRHPAAPPPPPSASDTVATTDSPGSIRPAAPLSRLSSSRTCWPSTGSCPSGSRRPGPPRPAGPAWPSLADFTPYLVAKP